MANSSPWARRLVVLATFAACITALGAFHSGETVLAARKPTVQSYALLPGQSMNFANRKFHHVEVRSTYPIRVLTSSCHQENVVQFFCDSKPGDIFITDLRGKPIFRTPEANQITITEAKK